MSGENNEKKETEEEKKPIPIAEENQKANDTESDSRKNSINIERVILIGILICTIVTTVYSVRTSRTAIKMATVDLRPWLSVVKMGTVLKTDLMTLRIQVENVGKVPVFWTVEHDGYVDGKPTEEHFISRNMTLMPRQWVYYSVVDMGPELFKAIKRNDFEGKLIFKIHIYYGVRKDNARAFDSYYEIELNKEEMSNLLEGKHDAQIWNIVASDFK